jgi:hypothetical protein
LGDARAELVVILTNFGLVLAAFDRYILSALSLSLALLLAVTVPITAADCALAARYQIRLRPSRDFCVFTGFADGYDGISCGHGVRL